MIYPKATTGSANLWVTKAHGSSTASSLNNEAQGTKTPPGISARGSELLAFPGFPI